MIGVVEFLKETYGFIRGNDTISYFFIPTGLQKSTLEFNEIKTGMGVEFTPIQHPKGLRAIEIRVLTKENPDGNKARV